MPSYIKEYWETLPFDRLDSRFFTKKYTKAAFFKAASHLCRLQSKTIISVPMRDLTLDAYRILFCAKQFHNKIIYQADALIKAYKINQIWYSIW